MQRDERHDRDDLILIHPDAQSLFSASFLSHLLSDIVLPSCATRGNQSRYFKSWNSPDPYASHEGAHALRARKPQTSNIRPSSSFAILKKVVLIASVRVRSALRPSTSTPFRFLNPPPTRRDSPVSGWSEFCHLLHLLTSTHHNHFQRGFEITLALTPSPLV